MCACVLSYSGTQIDSMASSEEVAAGRAAASQCLVAIGRLQVTSSPNSNDMLGTNGNSNEFISRHSVDGKFTFVDQRYVHTIDFVVILGLPTTNLTCVLLSICQYEWDIILEHLQWVVNSGISKCCWLSTRVVFSASLSM